MRVSCGIVLGREGRILIAKRGPGRKNAGLWEFPGGKREAGETPEICLVRELREEMDLPVTEAKFLFSEEMQDLNFDFVEARTAAEPVLREHEAYAWVTPREMLDYVFCPADTAAALRMALNDPPITDCFWDFDGTLIDSYPISAMLMQRAAERYGFSVDPARAVTLMKQNLKYACRVLAEENGVSADALMAAFRAEEAKIPPDAFPPLPGIAEALKELTARGCRHWLLTHRNAFSWDVLEAAGLRHCFSGGVTAENGFPRKPQPDSLLWLIGQAGADPAACVMIGDRPLDIGAGHNAGTLTCMLDPENWFPEKSGLRCAAASRLPELLRPAPILL